MSWQRRVTDTILVPLLHTYRHKLCHSPRECVANSHTCTRVVIMWRLMGANWKIIFGICVVVVIHIGVISYFTRDYTEDTFVPLTYARYYSHYDLNKCTPNAYSSPNNGVCSNELFQSYFRICRKLPEFGNWTNISEYKNGHASFSTPLCRVQNVSGEILAKQLIDTQSKRIFMIGDSHGFRYFTAVKHHIQSSGYQCKLILQEEGPENGRKHMLYYLATNWGIPQKSLTHGHRGCYSCRCTLLQCKHATTHHSLELEFLGLIISSSFILPNPKFCSKGNYSFCAARSGNELIFKYYLEHRKPDIVVISTTSSHDFKKQKGNVVKVDQVLPHYKALKTMVDSLYPKLTMWITTVFQRHQGFMNEEIHAFNQALFSLLEKDLTSSFSSRLTMIGFDHTALARQLSRQRWSKDSIHYHKSFYMEVISQLMNQFCSIHPNIMRTNQSIQT